MTRTLTVTFLVLVASAALGGPLRLEVQTLPPVDAAEPATMERVSLALTQALTTDLSATPAPDLLIGNAAACAEDLSYQKCLLNGAAAWDPRSLAPAADGADAVVLFVFDRSSQANAYRGVFYLVPRSGKWVSAPFMVKIKDNRAQVRSSLVKMAREAGFDVPDAPIESSFSASALK
jgi:hypothetical protein